jgi:hypothetical protein
MYLIWRSNLHQCITSLHVASPHNRRLLALGGHRGTCSGQRQTVRVRATAVPVRSAFMTTGGHFPVGPLNSPAFSRCTTTPLQRLLSDDTEQLFGGGWR